MRIWRVTALKRSKIGFGLLVIVSGFIFHAWFISFKNVPVYVADEDYIRPLPYHHNILTTNQFTKNNTKDVSLDMVIDTGIICSSPQCNTMPYGMVKNDTIRHRQFTALSYNILSGYQLIQKPTVCLNGRNIVLTFEGPKAMPTKGRGMHTLIIDGNSGALLGNDFVFDTYLTDYELSRYLKSLRKSDIIILICFDECSANLSPQTRKLIGKFGSLLIRDLEYRENFLMIGQLGLVPGQAIEKIGHKQDPNDKNSFGKMIEISGCLNKTIGKFVPNFKLEPWIRESSLNEIQVKEAHTILLQQNNGGTVEIKKCAVCPYGETSLNIYIGNSNQDTLFICLDDKIYFERDLNEGGRGINLLYVNGTTFQVDKVARFDTFLEDSTSLELLIESMLPGDIIILATFDEASTKLTSHVKALFQELGSSMIQNLKFRGSWYFVGRKGITGFSSIEDMEFPETHGFWAPQINVSHCLNLRNFTGIPIKPDPTAADNVDRYNYCKSAGDVGNFCTDENVYEPLTTAPLIKPGLAYHAIYDLPIYVLTGYSLTLTRMTLETLSMQPGIKSQSITVVLQENLQSANTYYYVSQLAQLFAFKTIQMPFSQATTKGIWGQILHVLNTVHDQQEYVIFIMPNVILSPDFIHYLSQGFNALKNSSDLAFVSAQNPYGFHNISGTMPEIMFRADFDALPTTGAFLLKLAYLKNILSYQHERYCNRDHDENNKFCQSILSTLSSDTRMTTNDFAKGDLDGPFLTSNTAFPGIFPDTSRVYYLNLSSTTQPKSIQQTLNTDPFAWITDTQVVSTIQNYENHLKDLIESSKIIMVTDRLFDYLHGGHNEFCLEIQSPAYDSSNLVFVINPNVLQHVKSFDSIIRYILKCFVGDVINQETFLPIYKAGLFRFTFKGHHRIIYQSELSRLF